MATDTARINLELASGRNEVTAPFQNTARHRRNRAAEPPIEAEATELPARIIVAVPEDEAPDAPTIEPEITSRPIIGRPTWIAFIGAILAVAVGVWWVMSQRLPDIDPREVIQRNLGDARSAMAQGRYTDPQEHSAFHYYSTVLALDPDNADAIAGIDAIADRHLTNARVMLAEQRVAEAAVAIDRARRVRPDHSGLPNLDAQLRAELKRILAVANASLQIEPVKAKLTKASAAPIDQPLLTQKQSDAPSAAAAPSPAIRVANAPPLLSLAPIKTEQTSPITPVPADENESGSAPVVDMAANGSAETALLPQSAPAPVPAVAPKLVKMVQPEYPQEALMRGIEGWVDVSLEVNAAGDVLAPRIEDSSRGRLFNRAALNAVQQWKYEPRDAGTSERVRVRLQFRHSK
jgi:TonB family protein